MLKRLPPPERPPEFGVPAKNVPVPAYPMRAGTGTFLPNGVAQSGAIPRMARIVPKKVSGAQVFDLSRPESMLAYNQFLAAASTGHYTIVQMLSEYDKRISNWKVFVTYTRNFYEAHMPPAPVKG
jgi:hypothetical protein